MPRAAAPLKRMWSPYALLWCKEFGEAAPTKLMIQVSLYKKGFETTRRNTNSNSPSRSAKLRVKISKKNLVVDITAHSLHCCLILTEFLVFFAVALALNQQPVS